MAIKVNNTTVVDNNRNLTNIADVSITGKVTVNASTGTAGQVLTSAGSAAAPTWSTPVLTPVASQAEAEAGTNNTNMMTALRTFQAVGLANSAPVKSALNAAGSPPIYACRAWANISGAGGIYGSQNVSAVGRNGAGNYTVYFTTSMPDTGFGAVMSSGNAGLVAREGGRAANYINIVNTDAYYAPRDSERISVAVFR